MYSPDPASLPALKDITQKLQAGDPIKQTFVKQPTLLTQLSSGELCFDSGIELDTDGWPDGKGAGDSSWQPTTNLTYHGGGAINANTVPYFVLPLPSSWPSKFGISLGDYGAVVCKNRLVFGVFADRGPSNKLGEVSMELLRKLGQERLKNGHVINAGLDGHAITIVFPGSGAPADRADEATLLTAIDTKGRQLFDGLGGDSGAADAIV
jgi:hypothetical protein